VLTDADALEAEVKRTMIGQAGASTLLVDRSKLSARGLTAIAPVTEIACVLGADLTAPELAALRAHGVQVRTVESSAAAAAEGAAAS
jgi:DeoR/GlpR family transcriptional regulator of sugar metabolism